MTIAVALRTMKRSSIRETLLFCNNLDICKAALRIDYMWQDFAHSRIPDKRPSFLAPAPLITIGKGIVKNKLAASDVTRHWRP